MAAAQELPTVAPWLPTLNAGPSLHTTKPLPSALGEPSTPTALASAALT